MDMLSVAQSYARRGWCVFPLHTVLDGQCTCGKQDCSDAGKHPRTKSGVKAATRDEEQIEKWFGKDAPPSNIAIATGNVSGITVLDIDVGPGKKGGETWAELVRSNGEPATLCARTGSGGMHAIFRYNSALKTSSNTLGPGVDCRNDGGYIVAAPSLHRSGCRYEWLEGEGSLADLPAHLSQRKDTRSRPPRAVASRTLEEVREMLKFVPADDRDLWRHTGVILGREFDRSDEAWEAYVEWSETYKGQKGRGHDDIMREAFYEISQQDGETQLTLGTVVKKALDGGWAPKGGEVPIEQFVYYGPGNNYIYRPTAAHWIGMAVDSVVAPINKNGQIVKASDWLRSNRAATSMTSDPALSEDYLRGKDCCNGELIEMPGAAVFNTYRRPTIKLGDPTMAGPFLEHVAKVFNKDGDADQFLDYMAHRVQRPWEKPRFALLIAGGQGVGKDTAIEFCVPAIGSWNVANIEPQAFDQTFNEYAASTLVRISEAANLHEMSKWAFNERTKVLIAGVPETMQINPKYGQKFTIRLYCGVIITTNHLSTGIYIPADDRRYDVIDSATMEEMGLANADERSTYFERLWGWFNSGGASHVAACLNTRDVSRFSASNGQRKTEAQRSVVADGMSTDEWLLDALDKLGDPEVVNAKWITTLCVASGENEMSIRKKMQASMSRVGYSKVVNPNSKDGRWKIGGTWTVVYRKLGAPLPSGWTALVSEQPF